MLSVIPGPSQQPNEAEQYLNLNPGLFNAALYSEAAKYS
jgi:hypothetical protein